jgi:Tape measure protein
VAEEPVIINTLLVGAKEFVAEVQAEVAALKELRDATIQSGDAAEAAGEKTFIGNQALFTTRRLAYGGTLALVAAGAAALKLGFNYSSAMQQARVSLAPVFSSTQALNKELTYLYKFSAYTPFQFKDITSSFTTMYKSLHLLGYNAGFVNNTIRAMTDALSATPGNATPAKLNRVSTALQHLAYIGHLTGQVALQLARDGLPIYPALQKELGLTGDQIHNIGAQGITAGQAIQALNKFIESTPGYMKSAQRQALFTLHGAFTTFKDLLSQAMGGTGRGGFNALTDFFRRVDLALQPLVKGGKPVTLIDFVTAVDSVLSPKTHLVLTIFAAINGAIQGFIDSIRGVVGVIGEIISPLNYFNGSGTTTAWVFKNLAYWVGVYLGLLLVYKTYTTVAAIVTAAFRREVVLLRIATALLGWTMRIYDAVAIPLYVWGTTLMATVTEAVIVEIYAMAIAVNMLKDSFILSMRAMAVAGWTFLLDNPIGWIILAVVALTVGLVVLYYKWKAFRDLVNESFTWLKQHWYILSTVIAGPFVTAIAIIIMNFDKLKKIAGEIIDWLTAKVNSLLAPFKRLWGYIKDFWGVISGPVHTVTAALQGGGVSNIPATRTMFTSSGDSRSGIMLPSGRMVPGGDSNNGAFVAGHQLNVVVKPQHIYLDGKKVGTAVATATTSYEARQ